MITHNKRDIITTDTWSLTVKRDIITTDTQLQTLRKA